MFSRVPVLYRALLGSPEQFVVGAICYNDDGSQLVRANMLSRLECFYGESAVGAIVAIEFALQALDAAMAAPDFSLKAYRPAVSGLAFGEVERVEGRSASQVGSTWLEAMSSLYMRPGPETVLVQQLVETSPPETRGSREIDKLRLLFDYVAKRQPLLMSAFNHDLFSAARGRRRKPQGVFIDFSGARLVANFGILSPSGYVRSIDKIKRRMWDLKIARDQDDAGPHARAHEMIVQHPKEEELRGKSQASRMYDSIRELEEQADMQEIRFRPMISFEEIGNHLLAKEAA